MPAQKNTEKYFILSLLKLIQFIQKTINVFFGGFMAYVGYTLFEGGRTLFGIALSPDQAVPLIVMGAGVGGYGLYTAFFRKEDDKKEDDASRENGE